MCAIQQELKSNNLSVNKTINVAQNHPLWRLMSYVWCYALLMVHELQEEEENTCYLTATLVNDVLERV